MIFNLARYSIEDKIVRRRVLAPQAKVRQARVFVNPLKYAGENTGISVAAQKLGSLTNARKPAQSVIAHFAVLELRAH